MRSFELGDNNTRIRVLSTILVQKKLYEYCKKIIEKKKEYCNNKC
jgi:hypothetical protein